MPYYIIAWGASISFGLVAITGKLTSKHQISNPWLFNFIWHLFILLLTIPLAYINGVIMPTTWSNILFAGLCYALADVFYVFALQKLDISVMTPLWNLRIIFSAILSALFLEEFYEPVQYIFMGIIVIAGLFVSMDEKFTVRSFFQKSIFILIGSIAATACLYIFMSRAVHESNVWSATLLSQSFGQILLLPTIPLFYKEIKKLKAGHYVSFFAMAFFGMIGFLGENQAVKDNVTFTTIIISFPFSMFIAFLFSRFAPQLLEKHTLKVYAIRFAAAAVMIGATLKLTL